MADDEAESVAFSKLLCKITSFQNELRSCRSSIATARADARRLSQEKEAAVQKLHKANNEWHQRETESSHTIAKLQGQVAALTKDKESLEQQLAQKTKQLDALQQFRSESLVRLESENTKLRRDVKRVEEKSESTVSELRCQKLLTDALETELRTLKSLHTELREELTQQEMRTKASFESVQSSLVDRESLTRSIEQLNGRIEKLKMEAENATQGRMHAMSELQMERGAKERLEKTVAELEESRCQMVKGFEEERKRSAELMELLKSREETAIKVEETIYEQNQLIQELRGDLKNAKKNETEDAAPEISLVCEERTEKPAAIKIESIERVSEGETKHESAFLHSGKRKKSASTEDAGQKTKRPSSEIETSHIRAEVNHGGEDGIDIAFFHHK